MCICTTCGNPTGPVKVVNTRGLNSAIFCTKCAPGIKDVPTLTIHGRIDLLKKAREIQIYGRLW